MTTITHGSSRQHGRARGVTAHAAIAALLGSLVAGVGVADTRTEARAADPVGTVGAHAATPAPTTEPIDTLGAPVRPPSDLKAGLDWPTLSSLGVALLAFAALGGRRRWGARESAPDGDNTPTGGTLSTKFTVTPAAPQQGKDSPSKTMR